MATPALKPAPFYRPELDALRFFAFLAVFLCHALPGQADFYRLRHLPEFLATISRAGAFGVDLFFLLSAYLITSLLLRERAATKTLDVKAFYVRRILRIWPLYFFALGIAFAWRFVQPNVVMPPSYLLAYVLLAGNWMTVLFGPPSSFMSILWSVTVEEQFYLCWPVLLRFFSLRRVAYALIAIAWLTRLALALGPLMPWTVWPNTLARLDTIAIGGLLAGVHVTLSNSKRFALLASGLVLWLAAASVEIYPRFFTLIGYPMVTAGSALMFLAILRSGVNAKPLVYLGKISYGLYVYHLLALTVTRMVFGGDGSVRGALLYVPTALALTVTLAAISYRYLEAPALRLKTRFAHVPSRPV